MKTADIPKDGPSDWRREPNEEWNAVLGKLGEELSEGATKCFRAMIQGLMERDPGDGRTNLEHLQDELADIEALVRTARARLPVNGVEIDERSRRKEAYKAPWFDALKEK